MALDWYRSSATDITWKNVRWNEEDTYIEGLSESETRLLDDWIQACQQQQIEVHHFYDDSVVQPYQLPNAIALLKEIYTAVAQIPLVYQPPEERNPYDQRGNAFKRMLYILEEAYQYNQTLIASCD